ncbi:rhamnogalacturonan acetylesterase [Pedobacter sp. ASV28]|uniref:rhamnogalacturonan acetylesterase n=1 Tax=Pedobacter sp. ASV28 TaxID=2795123 RepID=UPI0018EB3C8B|nr:rhamnogalacturonan acetylesterase [Pedobacter sp. ASV28]
MIRQFFLVNSFLIAFGLSVFQSKTTVFIIGDSTAANKLTKAYPETGWGMPFTYFFDSTVVVNNLAKNGRSTRTFLSEGLWSTALSTMKKGDYVLIQFGHNDESKEKADRYTTPEQYIENLTKFVNETRSKQATPILITPVSRRKFDKEGQALETHKEYTPLVKQAAEKLKVALIDLDEKSRQLYQQMGEENSKLLFLQLLPNEHPNYPEGKIDNTHFSELGARKIAQIVLQEIKALKLPLADKVVKPEVKK